LKRFTESTFSPLKSQQGNLNERNGEGRDVQVGVKPHPRFPAIYQVTLENAVQRLATKNLTPSRNVYGEKLIKYEGVEYRLWDPFRSKLAAAILKNLKNIPIKPSHKILYLGAASGTTASHVSDIVGEKGHVYCVEFAPRSIRELVNNVCAFRLNMSPILEDARFPEKYAMFISGKVDDVYCDIAQPEQAKVLADNADLFLKKPGWIMLAVKAQSIDVTKEPYEIYKREVKVLENRGFRIEEVVHLEPYDKAHAMIVGTR
jgi:fibrillarin-like pre-rRNA processing protein